MKRKFWNWVKNEGELESTRTLFLNGEISDETWYVDEVTPQLFKDELNADSGDITVWINSPGGDVFAAAQIYNMLRDYKGHVTVKIDGFQNKFNNDKPAFLSLLETHIDIDEFPGIFGRMRDGRTQCIV